MQIETIQTKRPRRKKLTRVAAYCRVSDDNERLLDSLEAQKKHYEDLIPAMPGTTYVGLYYDEARTGTRIANRPGFQKLLADCDAGLIDRVVVKSISRFCRNTVDCLNTLRHLNDIGVSVYFEKENIDSGEMEGELLTTLLASFAQEESRSISENVKWGIRKGFEEGKATHYKLYGYRFNGQEYEIVAAQAEVIRHLFQAILDGATPWELEKELTAKNIPGPTGGRFTITTIQRILSNPKYTGNSILQREYIESHITHKRKKNDGELAKYIVEGTHPPIVSQETFDAVQTELKRRKEVGRAGWKTKKTWYSGKMICGECGWSFRPVHRPGHADAIYCGHKDKGHHCPTHQIRLVDFFAWISKATGLEIKSPDEFVAQIDKVIIFENHMEITTTDGRNVTWQM